MPKPEIERTQEIKYSTTLPYSGRKATITFDTETLLTMTQIDRSSINDYLLNPDDLRVIRDMFTQIITEHNL